MNRTTSLQQEWPCLDCQPATEQQTQLAITSMQLILRNSNWMHISPKHFVLTDRTLHTQTESAWGMLQGHRDPSNQNWDSVWCTFKDKVRAFLSSIFSIFLSAMDCCMEDFWRSSGFHNRSVFNNMTAKLKACMLLSMIWSTLHSFFL